MFVYFCFIDLNCFYSRGFSERFGGLALGYLLKTEVLKMDRNLLCA